MAQREVRNDHRGCVLWLTGLSGSGKSTIAAELKRELFNLGRHIYILDGENMRRGLCSDAGGRSDGSLKPLFRSNQRKPDQIV